MKKITKFASYVIYSIKQTTSAFFSDLFLFASYVIYSIKQTLTYNKKHDLSLLVMLFIVLSKLT